MTGQRRRGRRARHVEDPITSHIVQPMNRLPPYEVATIEQVDAIHDVSMKILEQAGIAFFDDESLDILKSCGADVDADSIVRFDRNLVEEYLSHCPKEFTHTARNPERSVVIGGDHMVFAPVGGPPYVHDRIRGRREGTYDDLVNFTKMAQVSPHLQNQGTETTVPNDIPFHERGLDIMYAHFRFGDKPLMGHYPIGMVAQDSIDMARIVFGEAFVAQHHVLHSTINVSSPRRLDDRMLGTLKAYAKANQIVMLTPFILAGAMGPVSILGTVAQANAEALAGIVFAQMVRKGTPCVYGPFLATIDLQSGAPSFGTPESTLAQFLSAAMARRYGLPFRAAGGYTSGKVPDSQSGVESAMSMFPSMLTKPNFILHAAGWMESGLTASYEKFALDLDMLGMLIRLCEGISWDEDEWALDAILDEVPPGGHHLGTRHTLGRFRDAFYKSELSDRDSYETWNAAGATTAEDRATLAWQGMLERYEQPPLEESVDEELLDFMARRRSEIDPREFQ
ncbi:MAG: trimethylamine methyltransferase family protein [Acidimicrobiia bacterium]